MSHHQNFVFFLGAVVVVIGILIGVKLFNAHLISSNKDAIINDLHTILADAYQYAVRPTTLGGGNGSFDGYEIPRRLASNDNAVYEIVRSRPKGKAVGWGKGKGKGQVDGKLTIMGTSSRGFGTVTIELDNATRVASLSFKGEFK